MKKEDRIQIALGLKEKCRLCGQSKPLEKPGVIGVSICNECVAIILDMQEKKNENKD